MALVACVMSTRPRKGVCPVTYGTAAQWSRWKWVTSMASTSPRSTSSKKGRLARPWKPGCTPQSSITHLPA